MRRTLGTQPDPSTNGSSPPETAASLADAVLREEAKRQQEQAARSAEVILPDDLLPGVGEAQQKLRETLRIGGLATMVVVVCIVVLDQFSRDATSVLGPDIQRTFGISDTTLGGIAGFGGVAIVLGAVPMAWLADRMSRKRLVVASASCGAAALAITGLAANPFQLFCCYVLVGFCFAFVTPVFGSLMSDQYPIQGRARIFALYALATPVGSAITPVVAGVIANGAGGTEGWRWAYLAAAIPVAIVAGFAAFFLREPPRG